MKSIFLTLLFAMVVITTQAFVTRPGSNRPSGRPFPTFPGHGPFNPRVDWPKPYRPRRSPEEGGSITGKVIQPLGGPERQPSLSLDYNHKIYKGQNGEVSVSGGVSKTPGRNTEANVGIQGKIYFQPRRPDLFPPSAWDIDSYGRERVIP